jgi:hypothetical protein
MKLRRSMEIFKERARKAGIDLRKYKKTYPAELMLQLGIPVIVSCTICGMTMPGLGAFVDVDDDDLHVYCTECTYSRRYKDYFAARGR